MGDHAGSVIECLSTAVGAAVVCLSLRADLVESDLEATHLLVDEFFILLLAALLFESSDFKSLADFAGAVDFATDAA